jgi:hypothetical protein
MEPQDKSGPFPGESRIDSRTVGDQVRHSRSPPSSRWGKSGIIFLALVGVVLVARAVLPSELRDYVNRTLDRNLLYEGRIGQIELHLWRGAYSIRDVHISKRTGNVPVPLFAARRVDFSVQWDALLHRRIVGRLRLEDPELNIVAGESQEDSQTGQGGPWLQIIRDLFPFQINSAVVTNGSLHFRTFKSAKPVDVYLSHLEATIDDLGNIRDQTNPLITTVQATAQVMDQAPLNLRMTLDPFSYRPTFHLAVRVLGLDVTKLNDLALVYGNFDFKRGWFDLVIEADSKEGQVNGYIKPLFRDLKLFSLVHDIQQDNVLQFFWQALLGGTTTLLKNYPRDQFGTMIPFAANASGSTTTDLLATVANVLRNAFIRAYLPRLEPGHSIEGELEFAAPNFTESLSTTAGTE